MCTRDFSYTVVDRSRHGGGTEFKRVPSPPEEVFPNFTIHIASAESKKASGEKGMKFCGG